jgi:hypothetical protein
LPLSALSRKTQTGRRRGAEPETGPRGPRGPLSSTLPGPAPRALSSPGLLALPQAVPGGAGVHTQAGSLTAPGGTPGEPRADAVMPRMCVRMIAARTHARAPCSENAALTASAPPPPSALSNLTLTLTMAVTTICFCSTDQLHNQWLVVPRGWKTIWQACELHAVPPSTGESKPCTHTGTRRCQDLRPYCRKQTISVS